MIALKLLYFVELPILIEIETGSEGTNAEHRFSAVKPPVRPGNIHAVADQAYGSYVDLALIQQQGTDGVLRKHHARRTDFRTERKNAGINLSRENLCV